MKVKLTMNFKIFPRYSTPVNTFLFTLQIIAMSFFIINCGEISTDPYPCEISPKIVSEGETLSISIYNGDKTIYVSLRIIDSNGNQFPTSYNNIEFKFGEDTTFYWQFNNQQGFVPGPNCKAEIYNTTTGKVINSDIYFHTTVKCDVDYFYVQDYNLLNLMSTSSHSKFKKACKTLLIDYHFSPSFKNPISMFPKDVFRSDQAIRDHVRQNYNNLFYNWKLFSLTKNPNTDGALGYASIDTANLNNPLSTVSERYAIVFTKDIQDLYSDNNRRQFLYWFATAHELGHERFGLTDLQEYPHYHNQAMGEPDPQTGIFDAYCIMDYNSLLYWQNDVDFIFCNLDYPYTLFNISGRTDNCWDNAYKNLYNQ